MSDRAASRLADARVAAAHWAPDPQVSILGDGHIHDTYLLTCQDQQMVLQRLNEYVFRDAALVMAQTERLLACWSEQSNYLCPRLQLTTQGSRYLQAESGFWRAWTHLPGETGDPPQNPTQAYAAGLAFARLQSMLNGLPEPKLEPTIEGFLDLNYYLAEYETVAEMVGPERRRYIDSFRYLTEVLGPTQAHIHGDCKVDNLLFDQNGENVVAILDFDTAMYASRALDFGDLVRSISASRGGFELEMYTGCLQGFCDGGVALTVEEATNAPSYVTFMLGLRFLTDHMRGDFYFKTPSPGENLERADRQFALLSDLEEQRETLITRTMAVLAGR